MMPSSPLECQALADAVIWEPCPVLFLDTAAILDIARVPFRQELQIDILTSAVAIIEEASSHPKRVWMVTTANVMQELRANRESVIEELESRIAEFQKSMLRYSSLAKVIFPERRFDPPELQHLAIAERVTGIMDRFVDSLVPFRGTPACVSQARDRLWAYRAPASRAQTEFKDCEIFEEFLELMRSLRSRGFDRPAVFITPNRVDYGKPPQGHPEIALDLSSCDARYASNLSWARAIHGV